jgi:hypothetical protein
MSFPAIHDRRAETIGRRLSDEARRKYGGLFTDAVPNAATEWGVSLPTARKVFHGIVTSAPVLFRALEDLGESAACRILEPFIGKIDQASIARRAAALLDERGPHARTRASSSLARPHGFSGEGGGDRRGGEGEAGDPEIDGGRVVPGLALVGRRLPLATLDREDCAALRRHLSFGKVVNLDAARRLMQSDNLGRTGLAYRRPGEDWTILPARDNRLWLPSTDPRRVEDFAGDVQGLRRDLDEASRSAEPIVVTHAGAFVRDGELLNFNSTVARFGGKAKCGARIVLTDFVRRAA